MWYVYVKNDCTKGKKKVSCVIRVQKVVLEKCPIEVSEGVLL